MVLLVMDRLISDCNLFFIVGLVIFMLLFFGVILEKYSWKVIFLFVREVDVSGF